MKFVVFFMFLIGVCGCDAGKEEKKGVIDLQNVGKIILDMKLSHIADSVHYILLETSDNCLLEGNCSVEAVTEKYIYIASSKRLYQFTPQGRFIRQIGSLGRGPEEFSSLSDVACYGDKIYIITWQGEIIVYNEQGKYVWRTKLQNGTGNCMQIVNDSVCIVEEKEYGENGELKQYLGIYKNGEAWKKVLVYEDDMTFERAFMLQGSFYRKDNSIYYRLIYNNTIFRLDENYIPVACQVISFGSRMPARNMLENFDDRNAARNAGYVFCTMFLEANRYSFIWSEVNNKSVLTVYDKQAGELAYSQTASGWPLRENHGIEDDITGWGTYFWPLYISNDGKVAVTLTNAVAYNEEVIRAMKEKNIVLDENSNPVVSVVYLKN